MPTDDPTTNLNAHHGRTLNRPQRRGSQDPVTRGAQPRHPIWQRDCWRYVRGELDRRAFLTATGQVNQRLTEQAPFWPFATQHTIADTWHNTVHRRHDAYLLDTSIDVA